jgi:hypothetical protein
MKKILKLFILLMFITSGFKTYSQIHVICYSNNVAAANIEILKNNKYSIAGELKIFTNKKVIDTSTEFDLFYKFKTKEYHRFSVGLGFKTEFFTDGGDGNMFLVPVNLEVFPLQDFNKLSFLFEFAPVFELENQIILRSMFGISYAFGE